jgi:hypothetical protein
VDHAGERAAGQVEGRVRVAHHLQLVRDPGLVQRCRTRRRRSNTSKLVAGSGKTSRRAWQGGQ